MKKILQWITQNIGDFVLSNTAKWYVSSYDRGLEVCLKEFERYLETKKIS